MTEKRYFYQNKLFSVEDDLFYENDKRIGYFEDEEECEIKINNYKKTVDRLEELREGNIDLKRLNKKFRKENEQLKQFISKINFAIIRKYDNSLENLLDEIYDGEYENWIKKQVSRAKKLDGDV